MMSEPTRVDRTTLDELTGKLVLVIEEDRPWGESELMHRQLSAKVRHYVRHIRSREFAQEHGQRPQDTIVRLVSAQQPGEKSLKFMEHVGYELSKHGIEFEYQLGDDGIPVALVPGAAAATVVPAVPSPPAARPTPPPPQIDASEAEPVEQALEGAEPHAAEDTEPEAATAAASQAMQPPPSEPELSEPHFGGTLEIEAEAETAEPVLPETESLEAATPPVGAAADEAPAESEVPQEVEPTPSFVKPEDPGPSFEPAVPAFDPSEHAEIEEPSELELLIESTRQEEQESGDAETATPPLVSAEAQTGKPKRRSPFFPEEEFGRALPDVDEVEAILMGSGAEPAVIETSSGQRIRLDVTEVPPEHVAARAEGQPSLSRAIGAAVAAAVAGAVIWAGLSLGAGHGASPLAVAIALMVGISARVRGNGHTLAFRLVGVIATLIGSLAGATLAAAALSAWQDGAGLAGILANLSGLGVALAAIDRQYAPYDLAALLLALYVAFKLSASKPSS